MDAKKNAEKPTILASVNRRLAARLIDCAITVLIVLIVKFGVGALSTVAPAITPRAVLLSTYFAGLAYFLLADALPNGQSLGKRLLSIATVDHKTLKGCSVSQSITRNAGALMIVDWMWILMESRTRLGDMFAKTIVIQTGNLTSIRGITDIYDSGKSSG